MNSFRIMFVCTGNICRSPAAHAALEHMAEQAGLGDRVIVESSGTDAYHVGEQADSRMRRTAAANGIPIHHRSQQLRPDDIGEYDLVLTMDRQNYRSVQSMCRSEDDRRRVRMFRDFDPQGSGDVPDPWYGGPEGFEEVWTIVERTCANIIQDARNRLG